MNESKYGSRDTKGHWKPFKRISYGPLFSWPPKLFELLKWFFGYNGFLMPWNLFYFAIAALLWFFLTPPLETLKTLQVDWVIFLLVRNAILTLVCYGFLHFRLYIRRSQGALFKYNPKWLDSGKRFVFGDQTHDNLLWTFGSAVPIWTAFEVYSLWAFANGYFLSISWEGNAFYFVLLLLLIPLFREFHFYLTHRLLHVPVLYKYFHIVHHRNINPGPWSGLSMHPFEHVLYFSGVLIHFIIPAHPLHAVFQLVHAAISPGIGAHSGFDKIVVGGKLVEHGGYAHYLHHKYFECNYADGAIPLDKWFGTFHDGSEESHLAMRARLKNKL